MPASHALLLLHRSGEKIEKTEISEFEQSKTALFVEINTVIMAHLQTLSNSRTGSEDDFTVFYMKLLETVNRYSLHMTFYTNAVTAPKEEQTNAVIAKELRIAFKF
jgi:hypothetical protein